MIFCSKCGIENVKDGKFCTGCGHTLGDPSQVNTISGVQHEGNTSAAYAILGWVFSAISILFFPILFAAGGVIFGYLHRRVNHTHGTIIMIAAIACGLFGMVLGAAVAELQY